MGQVDNYNSLLERAKMFLEDKEWDKSIEYFERVLDINPKCGEAYAGKFLSTKQIDSIENLKKCFVDKVNHLKPSKF